MLLTLLLQAFPLLIKASSPRSSCSVDLDSVDAWPEGNPPILTSSTGDLLLPLGEDQERHFSVGQGQEVLLGCPGSSFDQWPEEEMLKAVCVNGASNIWLIFSGSGASWEEDEGLGLYECQRDPSERVIVVGECGANGESTEIQIDFDISQDMEGEAVTITVCHDMAASATLWSRHTLWDEIKAKDTGHSRPSFKDDGLFDFDVNEFYKTATQRDTIGELVGSSDLADEYVQGNIFLSRGHLAPNADFIFGSWMDSSFHFVNVAPQWQCINGANWATLEAHARDLAIERSLDLVIFTGTHGVLQLKDVKGDMVDIFLYNKDQLPVPRYFWKILLDPEAGAAVAIININNPHLEALPEEFIASTKPIPDHPLINGINDPTDIVKGYMWACRVEDLAAIVPEVPSLPTVSLLV